MDRDQEIKMFCEGMGWKEILPRRNPVMISFRPEENYRVRLNVYYTTMTVTIQDRDSSRGFCETYRDVTMDMLEKLLEENRERKSS